MADFETDLSVEGLTDHLSPAFEPPSPAVLLQARRNAQARAELLREFGALTATEIAEERSMSEANPSALASRWRAQRKVFAVSYKGTLYYPGFQFDDDLNPLPVIRRVLEVFAGQPMSDWEKAIWFTSPTGALYDRRPVDLLHEDPEAVVAAAEQELAPVSG